ncbi:MAG: hypothetical protein IT487_20030 [Chromatiaceae bacterium]|nr:hypothetical protein [Chromatiaceae bacterium]
MRPDDEAQIERVLTGADWDTLQDFTQDGMPLGSWAKDILVNNYVVADDRLIPDHEELGLSHLRNLLRLKIAYARILDDTRPDRVIANDSYYGMWAILQQLCEQRGIPFYTHWPVTRDRVAFAHAGAAMGLDFRPAWPAFCASPLSSEQRQRVEDWLNGQSGGRGLLINTAVVESHQNEGFDLSSLNTGKPTALLTANVIWDLAALNKQVVFAGMMEWIISTIEWFARHPEYQLILKAHPAEQHPTIPETHERVESVLLQRGVVLPANVFFVSPRAKVSVYDFLPLTRVGIVHTTSVGFEMAAFGLPVITTARAPYRGFGFTYDVETPEDYFSQLSMLLAGDDNENKQRRIDLAYKFISFYHFHYYIRLGLSESRWNNSPLLHVQTANELLPGRNRALDYIVDSILNGLPIVSKDRWPVES